MLPKYSQLVMKGDAYKMLKRDTESGNVSHAYLLISPDCVSLDVITKLFAAEAIAGGLESPLAHRVFSGAVADIITLPEQGEKVLTKDVEYLTGTALYTPTECEYKYYVIRHGETMNDSCQNKLLKTLEEPPPHVRIIIQSASEAAMLPTVCSRCRRVELRPYSSDELYNELTVYYPPDERTMLAASAARGSLAAAESVITDELSLELYGLAVDTLRNMKKSSQVLPFAAKYLERKDKLPALISYLEVILRDLIAVCAGRYALALNRGSVNELKALADEYPPETAVSLFPVIDRARKRIKYNGNPAGIVDELLFSILEVKAKCRR